MRVCFVHPHPSPLPSRERGLLGLGPAAPGIPRSLRSRPFRGSERGMDSCLRRNDEGDAGMTVGMQE